MQTLNVRETREQLSRLLDAVAAGEEVLILRHGRPAARLTAPEREAIRFPDRSALRQSLPAAGETSAQAVRSLREEDRY